MSDEESRAAATAGAALPILDLSGDGLARGLAHGEALRTQISEALEGWRDRLESREQQAASDYIRVFLSATSHVSAIATHAPDLHSEVVGIAAASNQPLEDIFAYNLMDEEWRYAKVRQAACSLISTRTAAGHRVIGQNMDLPTSMGNTQIVLRIAEAADQPQSIVLSAAGLIGLFGINRAGFAVCVNTLHSLPYSNTGVPVAAIIRSLLHVTTVVEGADYLRRIPHASGQHYGLADPHSVRGFECSADGCVEGPQTESLVHTNHPLWQSHAGEDPDDYLAFGTRTRLESLEAGLHFGHASGSVRSLLSSSTNGLCVLPTEKKPSTTFCSAEFLLADPPRVGVVLGRPDLRQWLDLDW